MTEPASDNVPQPRAPSGWGYLTLVGGLLLLIVVLLGALVLRERTGRLNAETQAAQLQHRLLILQDAFGQVLAEQADDALAVRRDDLPAGSAVVDGEPRALLHVGAAAGRRLGFLPGDLVMVAQEPAESAPVDRAKGEPADATPETAR